MSGEFIFIEKGSAGRLRFWGFLEWIFCNKQNRHVPTAL